MIANATLLRVVRSFALSLALCLPGAALLSQEANVTRTNLSDHWITNVVEVRMAVNRFVNQYRTNWVTQLHTNVIDVCATNRVTRTLTNRVEVAAIWTNYITARQTNWSMRTVTNPVVVHAHATNYVTAYRTNLTTTTLTNHVAINLVRTNLVDQYRTNWSTLTQTNWTTVVQYKTNWITQPATKLVQIDLPTRPPATAATWSGPLAIEVAKATRLPANNLVEVRLRVKWTGGAAAPPQVENWRVEREGGAVLLFGQEQEFKHQLPVGSYKVEAKVRAKGEDSPLTARGTLSVSGREVTVQPRLLVTSF
jgi:hypothetical protein